jgi:hypothetical protein
MIEKGEIMFEIKKIVKSNIEEVRKYLAEVPRIKEINDSILSDGLVVYLNNKIQLVVSYVINNNTALIRYFVYKRGLDEMIIKEVFNILEKNIIDNYIDYMMTIVNEDNIFDVYSSLGFRVAKKKEISIKKKDNLKYKNAKIMLKKLSINQELCN